MKDAIVYKKKDIPFELVVERLCQKYHKLPSEVLEEEWEWINILVAINKYDVMERDIQEKRNKLKNTR